MPPSVARLEAEPITLETVRAVAKANFDAGYRFVTLSVHNLGDGNLDIIYHYDKNLNMRHYRLTVPLGQAVPAFRTSISALCSWKTKAATSTASRGTG